MRVSELEDLPKFDGGEDADPIRDLDHPNRLVGAFPDLSQLYKLNKLCAFQLSVGQKRELER